MRIVEEFLIFSFPNTWNILTFGQASYQLKWWSYLESIKEVASKVTTNFDLWNMIITQEEFHVLMEAISHCEFVTFAKWKIETDSEWDFSLLIHSNIKKLNFPKVGESGLSNWEEYPHRLLNIFLGIKHCFPLRSSLNSIDLWNCKICSTVIKRWIYELDLNHIITYGI